MNRNAALQDIKVLVDLMNDIDANGELVSDDGYYPSANHRPRCIGLNALMDKCTYGWYIAPMTKEEQLFSLKEFVLHIAKVGM